MSSHRLYTCVDKKNYPSISLVTTYNLHQYRKIYKFFYFTWKKVHLFTNGETSRTKNPLPVEVFYLSNRGRKTSHELTYRDGWVSVVSVTYSLKLPVCHRRRQKYTLRFLHIYDVRGTLILFYNTTHIFPFED